MDELRNIAWVSPDKIEGEQPIELLTNGAEAENSCLLINYNGDQIN